MVVLWQAGGVQITEAVPAGAELRLLVDGEERAYSNQEFHKGGYELRGASLMWVGELVAGQHVAEVPAKTHAGRFTLSWWYDTRTLQVIELRTKDQAECGQCCAGEDDACTGTTGACHCDEACVDFGDCCSTYCATCGGCD